MKLSNRYPQKRVLITGATSGFGLALSHIFAREGWKVAITSIQRDLIDDCVANVNKLGGTGLGIAHDVCDESDWQVVRERINAEWGGIDVLINNAGIADANYFVSTSTAAWEKILAVNLHGVIFGCKTFAPDMIAAKNGFVLNVASAAGLLAFPEMGNYNVSKAGVVALSETLFAELLPHNIKVQVLCPSGFRTNLLKNSFAQGLGATVNQGSGRAVARDFEKGVHTAESIAAYARKRMECGSLYVVPQRYYRALWWLKRIAPTGFYRLVAFMYRNKLGDFAD